jgi:hypothetical protein
VNLGRCALVVKYIVAPNDPIRGEIARMLALRYVYGAIGGAVTGLVAFTAIQLVMFLLR